MPLFGPPPKSVRSKKFDELKATGFKSTSKLKLKRCFIAVDEQMKAWFVLDEANPGGCKLHKFSEVLDVEIVRNDRVVTSTKTGSTLGRAAVGGLIFGAAGAIIGGNTASTVSSTETTKLGVRIVVDDLKEPLVYADCMYSEDLVDRVYATFVAIINRK